jgi:hypothetical protein
MRAADGGAAGSQGPAGAAGVATFLSTGTVSSGQCIGNIEVGTGNHTLLMGPMPAGGGALTNLQAFTSGAPTGTQSYTVSVLDATPATATVLLTCAVTSASSSGCSSTSTAAVAAGHYLEVRITNNNAAASVPWRVSFRYLAIDSGGTP